MNLTHPPASTGDIKTAADIARHATEHPVYKSWLRGAKDGAIEIEGASLKALFSTSAGFAPDDARTGDVTTLPLAPLTVSQIMPAGRTGQSNVSFMRQTVRTQAAAEVAEGAVKPEATFQFAEESVPVREIAESLPVTDIQLEDVAFIQGLLEGLLQEDVRQRLDEQIVIGSGVAPDMEGLLNVTGVQVLDNTTPADDPFTVLKNAGTLVRTGDAKAMPTHVILHPTDWDSISLIRDDSAGVGTNTGSFLLGNPGQAVTPRIWGWPVVLSETLTPGNAIIGSFIRTNIQLVERRGILVERGLVNDQFVRDQQTLRATMRAANVVLRPAAFVQIIALV